MLTLSDLANIYGCDKGEYRDKGKGHFYTRTYDKYLLPLKDKNFTLFEIGVKSGNSMFMWQDYFTKAHIWGMDIDWRCRKYRTNKIKIFIGNQANKVNLMSLVKLINNPIDIIIDDGSHKAQDIFTSLHFLKDYIAKGGLYFIEDIDPRQDKEMVRNYCNGLKDMKVLEYVMSYAGNNEELVVLQKLG